MFLFFIYNLGQDITLQCGQVESTLPFNYNWKLHNDFIDDEYSSTLTINNATSTSAGVYTCIVTSIVGQASSEGVTVNVYAPPEFKEEPDDINHMTIQEYQFDENITLICEAFGIPRPTISWFYKDFEKMEEITLYQFNSELILENINVSHAGIYYCKANNSHGVITSRHARINVLKVEFPEQFIEMSIDILKIEQNTSSADVSPSHFPENQTSSSSSFNETINNITVSSNLTLNNMTIPTTNLTDTMNYNDLFENLAERLRSSTNQEITYLSNQSKKNTVTTLNFTVKSILHDNNTNNFNSAKDVIEVLGWLGVLSLFSLINHNNISFIPTQLHNLQYYHLLVNE